MYNTGKVNIIRRIEIMNSQTGFVNNEKFLAAANTVYSANVSYIVPVET